MILRSNLKKVWRNISIYRATMRLVKMENGAPSPFISFKAIVINYVLFTLHDPSRNWYVGVNPGWINMQRTLRLLDYEMKRLNTYIWVQINPTPFFSSVEWLYYLNGARCRLETCVSVILQLDHFLEENFKGLKPIFEKHKVSTGSYDIMVSWTYRLPRSFPSPANFNSTGRLDFVLSHLSIFLTDRPKRNVRVRAERIKALLVYKPVSVYSRLALSRNEK